MTQFFDKLKRMYPQNREEWHDWLKINHKTSPGIWVIYYKKNSAKPRVSYDEAVEEALSFGWIDSKVNAIDHERFMQVFTPRRPGSNWSKINKERVHKLIKTGKMQPAGLKKVEAAKEDGSWNFLDDIEKLIIPHDLKKELDQNQKAGNNYQAYPESIKKQLLYWIATAKKEETRKKRINKIVESSAKNEKPL